MRGKQRTTRRQQLRLIYAAGMLMLGCSLSPFVLQATAQEDRVLGTFFLSGAAIHATLALTPADTLNPGVLNGQLKTADSDGNGTPDHVQNADAHLALHIRYRRNAPNLGARVSGEFVPFVRVTVTLSNSTTNETLTFNLVPHVGSETGWHYGSNVAFPGSPLNDTYDLTVRIAPPTGVAKHSDIAGDIEVGTYLDNAVELILTGIRNIDLTTPNALLGPTATHIRENVLDGTFNVRTQTAAADRQLLAQQSIESLRQQDPRPIAAIADQYFQLLQVLTQQIDATLVAPRLDADIVQAFADLNNNLAPDSAIQVISKTLLRVFFEATQSTIAQAVDAETFEDKTVSDTEGLYHLWDQGFTYFRALATTVGRESRLRVLDASRITIGLARGDEVLSAADLGVDAATFAVLTREPKLDQTVSTAFERGQQAIDDDLNDSDSGGTDDDLTVISVQQQIIRFSLIRGIYIAVLRELDNVLDQVSEGNLSGAEVNRVEGVVFYRILDRTMEQDNPTGNATIQTILNQPVEQFTAADVATVLGEFSLAFANGTIRELNAIHANFLLPPVPNAVQRQRALIEAEEARLFSETTIDDLAIVLGDTFNNNGNGMNDKLDLSMTLNVLSTAITNNDPVAAATARITVDAIVRTYITALGGDLLSRLNALTP
ncbi:MAG TPA: iron transporter [Candidatus Entotheonella sp.]